MRRIGGMFCAALLLLAGAARAAEPSMPSVVDGPIERLKPGEFFWAPQIAPEGPVTIVVSLKAQRAYAYRNGVPIGVSTVSTGKAGYETPTGVFTILQKEVEHKSNLYDDAPMPYMQRLTWDGIALHAGNLPGYPASHGCVRLPQGFAKRLFAITRIGLTVVITDEAAVPEVMPARRPPMLDEPDGHAAPTEFTWHPERARTGPVSIVVSGRDRRVVVLRNGVVIGSSRIRIDAPVEATVAYTLRSVDAEGTHWMRLPLPGQPLDAAGELTQAERARGHVPEGFRAAVAAILTPGATMLVTRESIRSSGTGKPVTVLTADEK